MCDREFYPRVAFAIPNVAHLFIIAPTGFVSSSETQPIDRAFAAEICAETIAHFRCRPIAFPQPQSAQTLIVVILGREEHV